VVTDHEGGRIRAVSDGDLAANMAGEPVTRPASPLSLPDSDVLSLVHAVAAEASVQSIDIEDADLVVALQSGLVFRMLGSDEYESWSVFQADSGTFVVGCFADRDVVWGEGVVIKWRSWFRMRPCG
jgi:hypothetical protein